MTLLQSGSATADARGRVPEYGSDLVVDLLQALGIEYAAFNPGASFRGLHDSLINYGGDLQPRTILCTHEEISVALAHGYAKATGRPMVAALHDVVGLQHACMAIFNAWCDRVPVLLLGGTGPMDSTRRRPWIEWIHTALVQGNHVRDFVKFDDQPASAASMAESILRAYRLMTAEPTGPVYVCLDAGLQEDQLPKGVTLPTDVQRWVQQTPVQADATGLRTAAEWLSTSRRPVILADTVGRSAAGVEALRSLAERLQAPVVDLGSRFNFPSDHPLEATERRESLLREADVILGVDCVDLWGALQANAAHHVPAGFAPAADARLISLTVNDLLVHSWASDYQRLQPVDLALVGDSRVALPALVDLVTAGGGAGKDRAARAAELAAEGRTQRADWEARARAQGQAAPGAIAMGYLGLALRDALDGYDWVLSNSDLRGWARRLWRVDQPYQYTGTAGGAGLGYGIGASLGVGLAYKGSKRIVVNLQPDGDLLYCSSALWTAAHERLPLLMVMLNNHSYYNSEEHGLRMAEHRGRPAERAGIGTRPEGPAVDFATVARGFGVSAAGPISDPAALPRALSTALEAVASGEPYLLDVVTEVR
ncbi:MAG TPA: thiamine pyrophosphate-binding protein [Chloroflexota bacterium]|jgi:thiamine pyrophosphate-dependent acetolactate synthase large subunit-like protein|nr:thiamine pyrophosphate-binding protein [Chloroflexota bacterium]